MSRTFLNFREFLLEPDVCKKDEVLPQLRGIPKVDPPSLNVDGTVAKRSAVYSDIISLCKLSSVVSLFCVTDYKHTLAIC